MSGATSSPSSSSPTALQRGLLRWVWPAFRLRRLQILSGVTLLWAAVLLAVPQFNLLNYYFSFAVALWVPLATGLVAARLASDSLASDSLASDSLASDSLASDSLASDSLASDSLASDSDALPETVVHATIAALALLAIPLLVVSAGAPWISNCDIPGGLRHYALGPLTGAVFGVGLGLFAGTFVSRKWATAAVIVVFWGMLGANAWHFYAEPPISAFNHFAGYWTGSVYDDTITITPVWARFRLYTLLLGLALGGGAACVRLFPGGMGWALSGVGPIATVLAFTTSGAFDLRRDEIAAALGGRMETEHFILHYPQNGPVARRIEALAADHELRWTQLKDELDLAPTRKIRSFIYESETQKQELIGAGATYIAKPWSWEIHLNNLEVGAGVLKHELAHVFGAELAKGFLKVPTSLFFFPKMAFVEGFAVALEGSRSRLTPHQWSAAMRAQGIAPPISTILKAEGFLGTHSGKAYTLAGSFLRFLLETRGLDRFRALYADGDLESTYDEGQEALIAEWERFVDDREKVPLTADDEALARFQFDQPGRFHRICTLEIAGWEVDAAKAKSLGDLNGAVDLHRRIVSFDGADADKRAALMEALIDGGRFAEARDVGETVRDDDAGASGVLRARTSVRLAELLWLEGRHDDAFAAWKALADVPIDDGTRRRLLVLIGLSAHPEPAFRAQLLEYLIKGSPSGDAATEMLAAMALRYPQEPLLLYLLGRRQDGARLNDAADKVLGRALDAGLAPELLRFETRRLRAQLAFRLDRLEEAEARYSALAVDASSLGLAGELLEWAERCRFFRQYRGASSAP